MLRDEDLMKDLPKRADEGRRIMWGRRGHRRHGGKKGGVTNAKRCRKASDGYVTTRPPSGGIKAKWCPRGISDLGGWMDFPTSGSWCLGVRLRGEAFLRFPYLKRPLPSLWTVQLSQGFRSISFPGSQGCRNPQKVISLLTSRRTVELH